MRTCRQDTDNITVSDAPAFDRCNFEKAVGARRSGFTARGRKNVTVMSTVEKKKLINRINQVNFTDGSVRIDFKNTVSGKTLSYYAKPDPCTGDVVYCKWFDGEQIASVPEGYLFKSLCISLGGNFLVSEPELYEIDRTGCRLVLPETCYEFQSRKVKRHKCKSVSVQCFQDGVVFTGTLVDFHALAFKIEVSVDPPKTAEWFNEKVPVYVVLSENGETFFSGECDVIRQPAGDNKKAFVFEPVRNEIRRIKPREFRSDRCNLIPSPDMVFRHPLIKKTFNLKVIDLSGTGFSVREQSDSAVLLPGIILPEVRLCIAMDKWIKCRVQVVRREENRDEDGGWVKCGLMLLEIAEQDHIDLMALLYQTKDRKSFVCGYIDLDALWDFFFETGFIYPKKYLFIQKYKRKIMDSYRILYGRNPHIARHFICREKGFITGHLSMIRFYEKTWLIHHHAARKTGLSRAGLVVLKQMERVTMDSYQLNPYQIRYLVAYYRPENKFPARLFGGAVTNINNPDGCSADGFAYFHHRRQRAQERSLGRSWQLGPALPEDLLALDNFYSYYSGGLMLRALDLKPGTSGIDKLSKEYARLGLKKERHLLALKKCGHLKAFFMVNLSNLGLNLSDLTNCISVVVVDSEGLSGDIFKLALDLVLKMIRKMEMPVMIFPDGFAQNMGIKKEKIYNLWILNMMFSDKYFGYINRYMKFIKR